MINIPLSFFILMKLLPHVMRNINEFNIPTENSQGYEILYFGVNLILMYRLVFDVEVTNSDKEIEVLIRSRKDVRLGKKITTVKGLKFTSTTAEADQKLMMSLSLLKVTHMHLY